MADDVQALFETPPPRDPAVLGPLIKAASRLHRAVFYCAVGFTAVLAAVIVAGADRDKLLTVLPASLVPLVFFGAPFLLFWRRGVRRLTRLAVEGQRCRARVTRSKVFRIGRGSANRIVAEFEAAGGARVTELGVAGEQRRHEVGDVLDLLFSAASPTVVIAHSPAIGVQLGRTMEKGAATPSRRALRITIGVIVGALLFAALMALLARGR